MGIIKKNESKSIKERINSFPADLKINFKFKIWMLFIAGVSLILDQITKALVVAFIPYTRGMGAAALWGNAYEGIFRIIHVRNRAVAFSLGNGLPDIVKIFIFIIVPLIVICGVILYLLSNNKLPKIQQFSIALIIGGGLGNITDRIFRFSNGVVDWVDTIWFGFHSLQNIPLLKLLSYDRWPTWNLADASVMVGCFILIVAMFIEDFIKPKKN